MFFRYGMNALQYGHQVAQNTTTAGLPCATAGKSTGCPPKSRACQAGAVSPCCTATDGPARARPRKAAPSQTVLLIRTIDSSQTSPVKSIGSIEHFSFEQRVSSERDAIAALELEHRARVVGRRDLAAQAFDNPPHAPHLMRVGFREPARAVPERILEPDPHVAAHRS